MPTTLPTVKVTRVEAGNGYQITCSRCPSLRATRSLRPDADRYADRHRASHQTPTHEKD